MRKSYLVSMGLIVIAIAFIAFKKNGSPDYTTVYHSSLEVFISKQEALLETIRMANTEEKKDIEDIKLSIANTRNAMKSVDFWLRYLEPLAYKSINGPLPVEWETEVFEKFEKPYKRDGAGLTLAEQYLEEAHIDKDSLLHLIQYSLSATAIFEADSITNELKTFDHFYLCNRLFLLNLAAIYTTGFECLNTDRIIPELKIMLTSVNNIYTAYNNSYPATPLTQEYLNRFHEMQAFVYAQPEDYNSFDHFLFIKKYVNPIFIINQKLILGYKVVTHSLLDYSLNKDAVSIFDKRLYYGQNAKGIFIRVNDTNVLAEIDKVGKQLFYDPILSGNNMRSCVSCHKSTQYFTDTTSNAALQFNQKDMLARNTPSLINSPYNHLLMMDGKHISLTGQAKGVIANPLEMNCSENEAVKKVLSCGEYRRVFKKLLKYTPQEKKITADHITSAITFYYNKFSDYYSPFDDAMNNKAALDKTAREGFNLFMGKAQCATCHFVPQFNGVKPPYIGSEFEVLGVPSDTTYSGISTDSGRYIINPAKETLHAFRTGSVRNAAHTKPYMHNGIFNSLEQVIDFYNNGGGAGRGLDINNQTLSADSLHLTDNEKKSLIAFIKSLDEHIIFEPQPESLPKSSIKALNNRTVGGKY